MLEATGKQILLKIKATEESFSSPAPTSFHILLICFYLPKIATCLLKREIKLVDGMQTIDVKQNMYDS